MDDASQSLPAGHVIVASAQPRSGNKASRTVALELSKSIQYVTGIIKHDTSIINNMRVIAYTVSRRCRNKQNWNPHFESIKLPRSPDTVTMSMLTCVCGSVPES